MAPRRSLSKRKTAPAEKSSPVRTRSRSAQRLSTPSGTRTRGVGQTENAKKSDDDSHQVSSSFGTLRSRAKVPLDNAQEDGFVSVNDGSSAQQYAFRGRIVRSETALVDTPSGPLRVRTLVIARVYKRWIFVSVVATLLFSFLAFPFWFETTVLPESVADVREALVDSALFRALADVGGAQRASAEALLGNFADIVRPLWTNVREAVAFGRGDTAEDAALWSEAAALGARMRVRGASARHPVVMIPGITSTCLELWEGKACASRLFRQRLWGTLTMMRVLLTDSACWREHLRLDADSGGGDPLGVRVRAAQGLEAADFLLPGFWVWARLIEAMAAVGYDHASLLMAAYDWRVDVVRLEARDRFFSRLRTSIEHLVASSGGLRVAVLAHSLGGIVFLYFMRWAEAREPGWVGRHVHAFVPIGVGFLGAPKAVPAIVSGESRDTAHMGALEARILEMLMSRTERLSLFRTWPGAFGMAPKGGALFWGDGVRPAPDQDPDAVHAYAIASIDGLDTLIAAALGCEVTDTRDSCPLLEDARKALSEEISSLRSTVTASDIGHIVEAFTPPGIAARLDLVYAGVSAIDRVSRTPADAAASANDPAQWSNALATPLPNAPEMTIYCMYGVGKATERAYRLEVLRPADEVAAMRAVLARRGLVSDDAPSEDASGFISAARSEDLARILLRLQIATDTSVTGSAAAGLHRGVYSTDGDGSVPVLSSGYMCAHGWQKISHLNPGGVRIVTREYMHRPHSSQMRGGPETADHVDILGNHELTMDILHIVTDMRFSDEEAETLRASHSAQPVLRERIFSQIREIAERISFP